MKVVKVCPECKKYNNYKLYECAFCGANLDDDTIEVDDDETELPISKQEEVKEDKVEEKVLRTCPMCGTKTKEEWCPTCGMFLEGIEETKEDTSDSKESDNKENLAKVIEEKENKDNLDFTLTFNNQKFNFNASKEINTFGRHDFDKLNNSDFISVSRKHIEYYYENNTLYFKDISSYGSYLNNQKMETDKFYKINNHDKIKLVYFEMEITF